MDETAKTMLRIAITGMVIILADIFIAPLIVGISLFNFTWGLIKIILWIVGILAIPVALIISIKRADMLAEGSKRVWTGALNKLRRYRYSARLLEFFWQPKDPEFKGELQPAYQELRVAIFTLMNWILRHDVFKGKFRSTRALQEEAIKREKILGRPPTVEAVHKNMVYHLEGSPIEKNEDTQSWELRDIEGFGERQKQGWTRSYFIIYKIMEQLKRDLEIDLANKKFIDSHNPEDDAIKQGQNWYEREGSTIMERVKISYNRYITSVRRFKSIHVIRAVSLIFLDQYNIQGQYKRGYYFARPGAKPKYYAWKIEKGSDNGLTRTIDMDSVRRVDILDINFLTKMIKNNVDLSNIHESTIDDLKTKEEGIEENYGERGINLREIFGREEELPEVDVKGYCVGDINDIQMEGKTKLIRKYDKKDIIYLHSVAPEATYNQILRWSNIEWETFISDLFKANYSPWSRKISDYINLIESGYINFKEVPFTGTLSVGNIGFDIEALKNPGFKVYRGRKRYAHLQSDTSLYAEPQNPYPSLSVLGLWHLIAAIARKRIKDPKQCKEFLKKLTWSYGDIEAAEGEQGGKQGG